MAIIEKIARRLVHMRLQPIRVFCFHQTSESWDESVCVKPDWIPLSQFKSQLLLLKHEGYHFISLQEAYNKIAKDRIRFRKYAVLTADDGLKCQMQLLPWLDENKIPLTLFINVKNLDGKTCGEQITEYFNVLTKKQEEILANKLYINEDELSKLSYPMLSIGLHGFTHRNVLKMTLREFEEQTDRCLAHLTHRGDYIPFYAYTFGAHSQDTDAILRQKNLIPVYMDGLKNYDDVSCIHRELLL